MFTNHCWQRLDSKTVFRYVGAAFDYRLAFHSRFENSLILYVRLNAFLKTVWSLIYQATINSGTILFKYSTSTTILPLILYGLVSNL